MRVLHVIPSVAPRYGGPSEAVVGLVAAQRAAGMDARIATTDADGPGGSLGVPHATWTEWRGVPTVFFPRWRGEAVKYSPALARWLRRNASALNVLHLHAFFSHAVVAGARAASAADRPYFVRPLGTLSRYGLGRHGWRKRIFLFAWGQTVIERAAGIHCTSNAERAEVEAFGARNAFVAPLGVRATEGRPAREGIVLFLGRLDPKKNVEDLIEAFNAVPTAAGWRLVIAGAGAEGYTARLRDLAANSSSSARIEFAGWVDESTRTALLARASLFVLPSRDENFGIAVAEAMAAGVPVIVSEQVALAADVRSAGAGWVSGADSKSLQTALAAAMSDPDERMVRGEAARRVALDRFSWKRCVDALASEYERHLVRTAA